MKVNAATFNSFNDTDRSTPISSDRRRVLGVIAASCAGVAGAAVGRAPAYSYIYVWRTPVSDGRHGPFHAAEIAFTFDNAELCDHHSGGSAEAIVLSKQISTAWVSFARTGDPNHADLPLWPNYTSEHRATMQFDSLCEVRKGPESQGLRLIAESP